jgi:hypothetical protein
LVIALLLFPIGFFCASNLWLQSRWGRSWIEKIIHQKTHWHVRVGGAGWLPGGQIWVDDLRVIVPANATLVNESTLLQIRSVSLRPAWRSWLRGSRKISEIVLSHPHLDLPLDLIKEMMPPPLPTAPAAPQATTTTTPQVATGSTPASNATAAADVAPSTEAPSPTVWLKIEQGQLTIRHPSQTKAVCEMQQISSALPVGGAPAAGHVECGTILALGKPLAAMGRVNIHWNFPIWNTEETTILAMGMQARGKMQLARLPGLPFAAMIAQDPQNWDAAAGNLHIQHLQSLHQYTGLLLAPATWRGESVAETQANTARIGSRQVQGFLSQVRLQLQGGLLRCVDFRWLGDDFGFTGNGLLSLRGDVLAHIRLIAPRTTAQAWQATWTSRLKQQSPSFQPLFNEDRLAIDVWCGGRIKQPWISFDHGQHLLDAGSFLELFRSSPTTPNP